MRKTQIRVRQVGNDLGDLLSVRSRVARSVHGFLESRRRDQLHGPGDLPDVLDRLKAFNNGSCFGHSNWSTGVAAVGQRAKLFL